VAGEGEGIPVMEAKIERLLKLVMTLTERLFYGTLTIKFEAGKIVQVKKEESIKLEG
jgi:hypothetical protein